MSALLEIARFPLLKNPADDWITPWAVYQCSVAIRQQSLSEIPISHVNIFHSITSHLVGTHAALISLA